MRLTRRTAIAVAVVCAGLAAILIFVYLQGLKPKPSDALPEKAADIDVVVAMTTIPPNSIITPEMLTVRKMSPDDAPTGAIRHIRNAVGYVTLQTLPAQEPITRSRIIARGARGLAGIVPAGLRAVTVGVDPIMGVAGLLKAGDRVDVVGTFEMGDFIVAATVLQDVELLALGRTTVGVPKAEADDDGKTKATGEGEEDEKTETKTKKKTRGDEKDQYPNATLAVTPEDAQKLMLADQRGDLRLALRPVGEHDYVPLPLNELAAMLGPEYKAMQASLAAAEEPRREPMPPEVPPWAAWGPPSDAGPPAPPPAEKPPDEVLVIRGGQRSSEVP